MYNSICRSDSSKSRSPDVFASLVSQDKTGISGAIVKSSNELAKTTPAGEYLTSALMDFDPDQFEGFAAIADGANKLLMLVMNTTPTDSINIGFCFCFLQLNFFGFFPYSPPSLTLMHS